MRRINLGTVFVVALALAFSTPAVAQDKTKDKAVKVKSGSAQSGVQQNFLRLSELRDKEVKNQKGEVLGSVEEMIVGQDGRIDYVILDREDSDKLMAVPWGAVKTAPQDEALVLNMDKARMTSAPSFDRNTWPDFNRPEMERELYAFYGVMAVPTGQAQSAQVSQQARERSAVTTTQTMVIPKNTVNEYVGKTVWNDKGEELGTVHNLAFDPKSGRITYAIISHGGTLGMGEKHVAVPWKALHVAKDKVYLNNVSKEKFASAPSFDRDQYPNFEDRTWGEQIHSYYGGKPYWEE